MKYYILIFLRKLFLIRRNPFYIFSNLSELYKFLRITWIEGNSQDSVGQTDYLKKVALDKSNILEIGFNAGHSAETFLSSNNHSKVTSIDEASHDYIDYGYYYLSRKFKKRLRLHKIDSAKIASEIDTKETFDLIFIDGFHSYEYAKNDMLNCKNLSDDGTLMILDDFGDQELSRAWGELIKSGVIEQVEIVRYSDNSSKAMGVARYL